MVEKNCQDLLLISLNDFYNKNPEYKFILKKIINGNHKLSLRLIDWLVTHYSRINNIYYWIHNNSEIFYHLPINNNIFKKINLYLDYRAQLKSYAKLYFDTFRRHQRISFFIKDNDFIETTIGQLNFFRWILNNNIITYALDNYDLFIGSLKESNLELLEGKYVEGATMIYVCENKVCQLPTSDIMEAIKLIK